MSRFSKNILIVFSVLVFSTISNASPNHICLTVKEGLDKICSRDYQSDSFCSASTSAYNVDSCLRKAFHPLEKITSIPYKILSPCTGFFCPSEEEALEEFAPIPVDIFKENSTTDIAKSFIIRHFNARERNVNFQDSHLSKASLYLDTKIVMEVPLNILHKIRKDGFLNTHQTNTSSAWKDLKWRKLREQLFFRIKLPSKNLSKRLKKKIDELLPKYAYVIPSLNAEEYLGKSPMSGYADTLVIFKNSIKKRSTITNGDSLFGIGSAGLLAFDNSKYILPPLTFYATNFTSGNYPNEFLERTESYIEAQIWGKLTMTDVDYIILGCYKDLSDESLRYALKSIPEEIPVYSCASDWSKSSNQYKKGARLR